MWDAASVVSTATPSAIPTCWTVLNSPDAGPASSGRALDMPSPVSDGSTSPAPAASTNTGSRSVT